METINTELEKLLGYDWEPEVKMYINNLKTSMKTYQYLITKATRNDILELVKLANKIKLDLINQNVKENELIKENEIMVTKENELIKENEILKENVKLRENEIELLKQEIQKLKGISNK